MLNNVLFEELIISHVIKSSENFFGVLKEGINHQYFTNDEYREIFRTLERTSSTGGVSPLIVAEEMKDSSLTSKLENLKQKEVLLVDVDLAVRKVREVKMKKTIAEWSLFLRTNAENDVDSNLVINELVAKIFSVDGSNDNTKEYNAFEAVNDVADQMRTRLHGNIEDGIPSGIKSLDKEIGCFYFGLFSLIIGRPGHGKTTLMVNAFVNNIRDDKKPLFLSLEMPAFHIMIKVLAIWTKIEVNKLFNPALLTEQERSVVKTAMFELSQKEFYIVDSVSMTVTELGMVLQKYVQKGANITYLDYVQLLKLPDGSMPTDAGGFRILVKTVREIARRVNRFGNMALVMGAQAGRSVETRPVEDRIPQMKDLEWSSSLEQDAAVVIGVMNREKYEGDDCEVPNQLQIGFPKHRYQDARHVSLAFAGKIQYICDLVDVPASARVERWKEEIEKDKGKVMQKNR